MNYGIGIVGFFTLLKALIAALSVMTVISFLQIKLIVNLNPEFNKAHTASLNR